jgi:hypothetical protein
MPPILSDGPSISLEDSADSLERAQQYSWEMLPTLLSGPRISLEDATDTLERAIGRSRRCYRMGPAFP